MTPANQQRAEAQRLRSSSGPKFAAPRPFGAILLFAAVYVAVLAIMFAPKGSFVTLPQQVSAQAD